MESLGIKGEISYMHLLYLLEKVPNIRAEIQAATYGMNWFIQHGYKHIIFEIDSELLKKLLLQKDSPPWRLKRFVHELQMLINQCFFLFLCSYIQGSQ